MTLIAAGHQFSQHSLNTYMRCKRRFLLKYIDRQSWPVPEDEDLGSYEDQLRRGRTLHEWIARALVGAPAKGIPSWRDELLGIWWRRWCALDLTSLPSGYRQVELPVVVPVGDYGLYARFDMLAIDPGGQAVVIDWKTLSRVPPHQTLRDRMQTRVYLYALVTAGRVLLEGATIAPEGALMRYWFSNDGRIVDIRYDQQSYARDTAYLRGLVQEAVSLPRDGFVPTDDPRQCARCSYRTLCRQVAPDAADIDWQEEDIDFALDLGEEILEP